MEAIKEVEFYRYHVTSCSRSLRFGHRLWEIVARIKNEGSIERMEAHEDTEVVVDGNVDVKTACNATRCQCTSTPILMSALTVLPFGRDLHLASSTSATTQGRLLFCPLRSVAMKTCRSR